MTLAPIGAHRWRASDVPLGVSRRDECIAGDGRTSGHKINVKRPTGRAVVPSRRVASGTHSKLVKSVKSSLQRGCSYNLAEPRPGGETFAKVRGCAERERFDPLPSRTSPAASTARPYRTAVPSRSPRPRRRDRRLPCREDGGRSRRSARRSGRGSPAPAGDPAMARVHSGLTCTAWRAPGRPPPSSTGGAGSDPAARDCDAASP
jgi:hypothetical protein